MIHREIFERGEPRSRSILEAESLDDIPERVLDVVDEVYVDGKEFRVRVDGHSLDAYLVDKEAV